MHLSYIVVTGKEFESLPSVTEKAMWKVAQSTTNSTVNLCVMRERERERERDLRRDHSGEERVLCVTFHEEDPEFEGNHMDATGTLRVNKLFK
jgi:hypothetical protein